MQRFNSQYFLLKCKKQILFLSFFLFSSLLIGQHAFKVIRPTAEAEADYIWMNIKDIKFFDQYHYQMGWPDDPLIDSLLVKSRAGDLHNSDYNRLKSLMLHKVYDPLKYDQAILKIQNQTEIMDDVLQKMIDLDKNWEYKTFQPYKLILTLYGPGGSYDSNVGQVILYATSEGLFKQYDEPVNTIIHEIIHIGIQESIVQELNLPHPLKERIVDRVVQLMFAEQLSDYKVQRMGYEDLDKYIQTKSDISRLKEVVHLYLKDHSN